VNSENKFFLVSSFPSPCLGTHLRPKPRLRSVFRYGKPGLPRQVRSQAGAWEREKAGAWEREKSRFTVKRFCKSFFPRSQAPAWERICARSPGFGPSSVTGSRGFPGRCVPKLGLGNEKKLGLGNEKNCATPKMI